MKVKVLIGFKDKKTGERYQPGQNIEVTEKRAEEILKKGRLIEAVPAETAEEKVPAETAEEKEPAETAEEKEEQKKSKAKASKEAK